MSLDWTTEILSHFIGLFEIGEERARLRDDYDRFKMHQAKQQDAEFNDAPAIKIDASYQLGDFTPRVTYTPLDLGEAKVGTFFPNIFFVDVFPAWPYLPFPIFEAFHPIGFNSSFDISYEISMSLDPAGSVATVTLQVNWLNDSDVILGDGLVEFMSPDAFITPLNMLQDIAAALQAFDTGTLQHDGLSAQEIAENWQATLQSAQEDGALPDAPVAATISVQFGASVSGVYVDGELQDTLPDIASLLPERLEIGEDYGKGTVIANGQAQAGEGLSGVEGTSTSSTGSDGATPSSWLVPDGHNVTTGGNFLINEASVAMSWLDAPMMAVMGDAFSVNAISQVNVVADRDTGLAPSSGLGTEVLNASQVSHITNPFAPAAGALPAYWVVAELDADVIAANWVEQFNFTLDNDVAEVSFSGHDTYLRLGDNSLVNANILTEIGYAYDLIVIGGSLININAISQVNVLFDDDSVTASGGTPGSVNGSGNVVANIAAINAVGVDSYSVLGEDMASIFDTIEEGYGEVHDSIAQLGLFDGTELLRVLHITGDLVQMNLIKQTNILGDADQVHVALDDFTGNYDDVAVNTGENALLNIASVATYGVDSDVYVGGEVYSDAMLVQAELIDTDADPLGVSLESGDLASEAVAFLADDMIQQPDSELGHDAPIVATTGEEVSTTSDSLQVMLA